MHKIPLRGIHESDNCCWLWGGKLNNFHCIVFGASEILKHVNEQNTLKDIISILKQEKSLKIFSKDTKVIH